MKKLMVANLKSNKNREQMEQWMFRLEELLSTKVAMGSLAWDIVIAPPMPSLMFVSNRLLNPALRPVALAVQDISPFPAGSYTGAVSAENLSGFSVKYAIVGHSERRRYFHETAQEVANKVDQCLENGITPIVCVDKEDIQAQSAVIDDEKKKKLIIAYEPHEYIGTGQTQEIAEILKEIQEVKKAFGDVPVLYGASVNPDTMGELQNHQEIAGFLVGSASLDVEKFVEIVR